LIVSFLDGKYSKESDVDVLVLGGRKKSVVLSGSEAESSSIDKFRKIRNNIKYKG
jgi:predicted nucleotidyltransferase